MLKSNNWLRRLSIVAGLAAASVSAHAVLFDPTITVDRALNSPTLTIRYSGASAALIELRVNGQSLGTRAATSNKQTGEANFTLDVASLVDGKNDIEVLLLDKNGRIVGSEKTTISADGSANSPVTLIAPKMGATVQGPVDIKVGFGREMRNSYVSFFINNEFKSMTNFAPYSYVWDTTRETNGWHEVEAWLVDENSSTFKTRKVRVFVNNPGGRTDRIDPTATLTVKPTMPATVKPSVTKIAAGTVPAVKVSGVVRPNDIFVALAQDAGTKPVVLPKAVATGTKAVQPKGVAVPKLAPKAPVKPVLEVRTAPTTVAVIPSAGIKATATTKPVVAPVAKTVTPPSTGHVVPATSLLRITKGFRSPNRTLAISFNSNQVTFDVQPRIVDNIPLTPFRHLIEKAGGEVKWTHLTKTVDAMADGRTIFLKIGDSRAQINKSPITLEKAPFIEDGRTIVPLSFVEESLNVKVEYDPATGHVLITK